MKIRKGLVSNSSSSSFMVAIKPGTTKEDIIKAFIGEENKSPFYRLAYNLTDFILRQDKCKTIKDLMELLTAGYLEDWEYIKENYLIKKAIEKLNDGWVVIYDSATNDSGDIEEQVFCEMDVNYESKNVVILKDGGF